MRFSIITPSYNQAQFLPHNLRTVSCQTGIDLEHIIVDPGSTDGSTDIARAAKHAILIAEPDRGQSHGITKGFDRSTGDVVTWLNSDDMYPSPDTLLKVQQAFEANPSADVIYGNVNFVDTEGKFLRKGFVNKNANQLLESFHQQVGIVQPGVFMRRKVFEEVGGPSESYNYCMDYEYWVRIAKAGFKWVFVDDVFSHHRWWDGMKTSSGRGDSLIEHFKVCAHYFGYIHWKWLERYAEFRATDEDGVVNHATEVDLRKKAYFEQEVVKRFVNQSMIAMLESSTNKEHEDTLAYVKRHTAGQSRYFFDGSELDVATSTHPDPVADKRPAWCIFDTTSTTGVKYRTYRVPGNFERHFSADWFDRQSFRAIDKLQALAERRKEHCVIVGNGPSLNQTDLSLLENADVIISNFAVISDKLRKYATYFTVVNNLVAIQGTVDFNRLKIPKIIPFWLANSINPTDETIFLPATVMPKFCTSPAGTFSWRSTVTFFNMQVAFALGYEQVTLIGVDNSYVQTDTLKEGDSIDQKGEDPNHFDPRYFQGKTWQAADTGNMEATYHVAREAFNAAGRVICNSTVGGKLEVFPRVPLGKFLGRQKWGRSLPPVAPASALSNIYPRLLMLDMTAMGNGSATGDLKSNLLDSWPSSQLLQIASLGKDKLALVRLESGEPAQQADTADNISAAIDAFEPDVVFYRPVPNVPWLHDFAMKAIRRLDKPLVSWVMDDWPEEIAATDNAQWAKLEPDFLEVINRSSVRLSICEAMSTAFEKRYGHAFTALANGVMPHEWPAPRLHQGQSLKVRYAGGLAKNMTRDSVLRISRAVEALARKGHRINFEINTQPWWHKESSDLFREFQHTTIETRNRPGGEYRAWLREADVSVIAYNFDKSTKRYVQYSQANKMPECLASGSALFAHGPRGLATIDYLAQSDAAVVVTADSDAAVEAALLQLLQDPEHRNALVENGRKLAFSKHNLLKLREEFRSLVASARAAHPDSGLSPHSGSYPGEFLAKLARAYDPQSTNRLEDTALLLRTYATATLLEPGIALTATAPGSELGNAIDQALATLPETDALRRHIGSVTERAHRLAARASA